MHYALERLQVSYGGDHDENPMQHLLVLKNRKELISQDVASNLLVPIYRKRRV